MDSDASVMEGNDIEDLGGGNFRTIAAVERYSQLDLYAMGLVRASDVPPFFYVESPTNVTPEPRCANRRRRSASPSPAAAETCRIADIVRAMGERQPSADAAHPPPPPGVGLRDHPRLEHRPRPTWPGWNGCAASSSSISAGPPTTG